MKKRIFSWPSFLLGAMTAIVLAAGALLLGFLFPGETAERPDSLASLRKIVEMEMVIRQKYLDSPDEQKQTDAMMAGLISGLEDPYAAYYTRDEYEKIRLSHKGYTQGIGVTIRQEEDGALTVNSVMEGYPAEKAGIQAGDVLLEINGTDLDGLTPADASDLIQKSEGESVTLRIRRGTGEKQEELTITVEKGELEITSAAGGMLCDLVSGKQLKALQEIAPAAEEDISPETIGYIAISRFNGTTPSQFADLYASLQEEGMRALIIDLRDNLGGMVEGCCDTLRQILPKGVIVYESDRTGPERTRECDGETPIDIPLVLLVNGSTASASEIFAGAVQDYGIGKIVGTQTYGKGVEQNSYTLYDGSVIKMTTTHYYTPLHADINEIGITPDAAVSQSEEDETDRQLEKAVELLQDS